MLFKPWAEVQQSRHLLDELDDAEDNEVSVLETTVSVTFQKENHETSTLVLISARLDPHGSIEKSLENSKTNELVATLDVQVRKLPSKGQNERMTDELREFYDEDEELEDINLSKGILVKVASVKVYKQGSLSVALIPHVNAEVCYGLAKQVLSQVQPKAIVVLAPVNVNTTEQQYAFYLGTNPGHPLVTSPLKAPYMISGPCASIISLAVRQGLSCDGILIRAEGPTGHELIDIESYENMLKILHQLGVSVENAKVKSYELSTLYL